MPSDSEMSRALSHALRHDPSAYALQLDPHGWAPIEDVLSALRGLGPEWQNISRQALARCIKGQNQCRHEIEGERVRALYGHSIPTKIVFRQETPPTLLFHGTVSSKLTEIKRTGLRPMQRQYVHLSPSCTLAARVARRKGKDICVLTIEAVAAHEAGTPFYMANGSVWLTSMVPVAFISCWTTQPH
jgi:putative RNA 2'-phosphotransferase